MTQRFLDLPHCLTYLAAKDPEASSATETETCSICMEDFLPGAPNTLKMLPCKHYFHRSCVMPWFQGTEPNHNRYPYCRTRLFRDDPLTASECQTIQRLGTDEWLTGDGRASCRCSVPHLGGVEECTCCGPWCQAAERDDVYAFQDLERADELWMWVHTQKNCDCETREGVNPRDWWKWHLSLTCFWDYLLEIVQDENPEAYERMENGEVDHEDIMKDYLLEHEHKGVFARGDLDYV